MKIKEAITHPKIAPIEKGFLQKFLEILRRCILMFENFL